MLRGVLHRAGVAILLMVTLLVPYARCQPPAATAGHDCCVRPSVPAAIKANCCIVRSELPAIVSDRAALIPLASPVSVALVPPAQPAIGFEPGAAAEVAQHSPPPAASVLRI